MMARAASRGRQMLPIRGDPSLVLRFQVQQKRKQLLTPRVSPWRPGFINMLSWSTESLIQDAARKAKFGRA